MKRVFAGTGLIVLLSCAGFGQTPTFGIADVHASAVAANALMRGGDLTGAPPWLNSVRVDVSAKLPATDATSEVTGVVDMDAFLPALKALLIERFKVAIHTEQRPVPGYALVAAKPKMQKANPATRTKCKEGPGADGKDPRVGNLLLSRLVTCQNMTMAEFAQQLPGLPGASIRGAVQDATGIISNLRFRS